VNATLKPRIFNFISIIVLSFIDIPMELRSSYGLVRLERVLVVLTV
jgi:hypothetical protein